MDAIQDWQALGAAWRGQETPAIDPAAIAAEVRRRGRRLRWAVWTEVAATVVMVGLSVAVMLMPRTRPLEAWVFAGLALVLVAYQAVVLWLRRRQLGDAGVDAAALVELELRRLRTTRRYWRISAWTGVGLWLGLYALFVWMLRTTESPLADDGASLGVALAVNVVMMPAACAWAWWRSRLALQQQARFEALRRQLRGT